EHLDGGPPLRARLAALHGHPMRHAGADLAPQPGAAAARALVDEEGVGEGLERRFGLVVDEAQARLPAGVRIAAGAAAHRLVAPLVLREQPDPWIAVGEVGALLQVAGLLGQRDPARAVGRPGLVA